MKVTKRRKVWVNFYKHNATVGLSRVGAIERVDVDEAEDIAVPFVERRPGDVVLSREQRRTLAAVIDWMRASSDANIKVQVSPELDALLRGGR